MAKSSFRVNKDISFDQLLKLIKGCEEIIESEQPISINSVEKLVKKKSQSLIDKLHTELLRQLWKRYQGDEDSLDFDLCHYEWEQYLIAYEYIVVRGNKGNNALDEKKFETLSNIDTLFEAIKASAKPPADQVAFEKRINNLKIISFDEEGKELTQGTLIEHLLGDVLYNSKRYFFIDKAWYLIKDDFIQGLNAHCNSYIHNHYESGLDKKWSTSLATENEYNAQYIGEPQFLVLDKVLPENIEVCDIMRWDDDNLYLYHVKAGFTNTMRDLCNQIAISANRIQQDSLAEKEFVKELYKHLKNKIGGNEYFDKIGKQTNSMSEADFIALFEKPITYVLAVLDKKNPARDIRQVEHFNSNIAKFSLQELSKDMRSLDVNFSVTQIWRPD